MAQRVVDHRPKREGKGGKDQPQHFPSGSGHHRRHQHQIKRRADTGQTCKLHQPGLRAVYTVFLWARLPHDLLTRLQKGGPGARVFQIEFGNMPGSVLVVGH